MLNPLRGSVLSCSRFVSINGTSPGFHREKWLDKLFLSRSHHENAYPRDMYHGAIPSMIDK